MFFKNGLQCGLKQLNPEGGWLPHHPTLGWDIETPEIKNNKLKILLQDDLTFYQHRVVELEKYKKHYGADIKKITFYTWHRFLNRLYPELHFVWYPIFLIEHLEDAKKHEQLIKQTFSFDNKKNKFLCLNARHRPHRDAVVEKISKFKNVEYSYTHKGIKSSMHGDWTVADYRDWNTTKRCMLTNTKNLLVASPLYNQTNFSLVTETRYNLPCDFVTEKTTQCWLALHPALYISNRYHVAHIRDWGFDVFDDLFDHGYDSALDSDRIEILFKSNQSQLNNGIVITDNIQQRLLKNREHYFNNFHNILTNTK